MLVLLPVIIMLLTAVILLILRQVRPKFSYPWLLAAGGAVLALISVFLWKIQFPRSFSLPPWQLGMIHFYGPAWLADGISFPYALGLAALATAVIWTSVVRDENEPMAWAGTLVLAGFGILAVAAENPLTLLLTWSAIDLFELITMLRSTDGISQTENIIFAFSVRLVGTGVLLWANLVSVAAGTSLNFSSTTQNAGVLLLIAAGLRLGVLPLHLPYRQENVVRRGFSTALRLVSAASSLALLARIPTTALKSPLTPYLLIFSAITALFAGWNWFRSYDEILGRPFWILGFASLAVAEALRGNPVGSTGWGVALILCGGVLFLFSARRRSVLWLPFLGFWAFSALPFSLTSLAWHAGNSISWVFIIPFLPAQVLLIAGFFHHATQPGDTSLESQRKWSKVIYPVGLLFLMAMALLLGFWGWVGASTVGLWWLALPVDLLAAGVILLSRNRPIRLPMNRASNQRVRFLSLERVVRFLNVLYTFLRRNADAMTSSLEGEGGVLWSFLLLVLILSILTTRSH
jgi:hypothetical protein